MPNMDGIARIDRNIVSYSQSGQLHMPARGHLLHWEQAEKPREGVGAGCGDRPEVILYCLPAGSFCITCGGHVPAHFIK